jgi:ubiquinone/menaquinone biosynthesis C-methylase UbiE
VPDVYTHGHHESVLRSHRWRTAENSAGYLLAELRPGQHLLDIGCGPGTISVDLARHLGDGTVIGIDASADVVGQAAADAAGGAWGAGDEVGGSGVAFAVADLYRLPFPDRIFDVVHAHQVLQHLSDPVAALEETRRVLRPDGLVAVRDGDYGAFVWAPADPLLDRWLELYHQVTRRNDGEADAGRHLPAWVRAAGYQDVRVSSSTWTFADPESRAWWGSLWADRVVASAFARQAVAYGLADQAELARIAAAWRAWSAQPDALFVVPHVEVLARAA